MIVKLGKATRETKDTGTFSPLIDGIFPPFMYWRLLNYP